MRPLLFSFSSSWSEWKHCDRSPNIHSHVYAPKQTHSTSDMSHSRGDSQPLHIKTNYIKKRKSQNNSGNHYFKLNSSISAWIRNMRQRRFPNPTCRVGCSCSPPSKMFVNGANFRTSHVGFHRLMGESQCQELMDMKTWHTSVLALGCCPPLDLGLTGLFPDTFGAPDQFHPTAHKY